MPTARTGRRSALPGVAIPHIHPASKAALGGSAFIGDRNEAQMRLFAHHVTGRVFHAGHDLTEDVPDEMADVVLPFLAKQT